MAHFAPQAPQFAGSKARLTQLELHSARPAPQVGWQVPLLQYPPSHATAQPPQWVGSERVSTHTPASATRHVVSEEPQFRVHWPLTHTSLEAQVVLQAPQCSRSAVRSTQAAPHCCNGASQVALQAPELQTLPDVQATGQVPQCAGSVIRSTQSVPQV